MEKQKQDIFQQQNSWFDCIGDIRSNNTYQNAITNIYPQTQIIPQNIQTSFLQNNNTQQVNNKKTSKDKSQTSSNLKRARNPMQVEEQYYTQNSSSNQIKSKISDQKQDNNSEQRQQLGKQHIYSKNYRQRKKQHIKSLQQENQYLKKKIQDLQFRVRQLQLEINRLKFTPQQKQFTIDQLNEQFLTKVTFIMEKNKQNPVQYKSSYQPTDPFYHQFMQTYGKHGFHGSNKTQIMNYYFNQILQVMLRDSQRYFFLMCVNSQNAQNIRSFPEYQIINNAFFDILQPDQDKMKRLHYFQVNLYPMIIEFVTSCKQFNSKFNKITKSMDKIHQFMRLNYPKNFDFARLRIVHLEAWFEKNKYTKMLRNLRCQWLAQIKKQVIDVIIDEKKTINGNKKKKIVHKQQ